MSAAPTLRSRFRGCLLGGAVGDALGGRDVILQTADDLYEVFIERRRIPGDRYPVSGP